MPASDGLLDLLKRLLRTHSPSGDEREIDPLILAELSACCDDVSRDDGDNIVGVLRGVGDAPPVEILAHKDEIGLIVVAITESGRISVEPLGGAYPWVYGEGPVDLLGNEVVPAAMCVGSKHTTEETKAVHAAKTGALRWQHVHLDAKLSRDELAAKGVHVGTRACVARSRKEPLLLGDHLCGYGLDDKGAVAAMLWAARLLRETGEPPPRDVFFAATTAEETGIAGGAFVTRAHPGATCIAVDIAPLAEEYGIEDDARPVVFYKDAVFIYHMQLADELSAVAEAEGIGCQRATFRSLGTDASAAIKYGHVGRGGCIGFPTDNTHGYEIARVDGIENVARLLCAYVRRA